MTTIKSLKGMVTLVTGAASGLGLATVKRLSKFGSRVMMCDLPTSFGANIASEFDDSVAFTPADVVAEDDVKQVISNIENKFGRLDAVINCAAISRSYVLYNFNTSLMHKQEYFEDVNKVNTTGTFNVIRLALGLMGKNAPDSDGSRGIIINTTGTYAFDGQRAQVALSASGGGIVGMTLPIARDLASQGIRCCSIAVGLFDTPLTQCIPQYVREEMYLMSLCPNTRFGNPDEYAHLVQFLIENPFMNGEVVRIDAGLSMEM